MGLGALDCFLAALAPAFGWTEEKLGTLTLEREALLVGREAGATGRVADAREAGREVGFCAQVGAMGPKQSQPKHPVIRAMVFCISVPLRVE